MPTAPFFPPSVQALRMVQSPPWKSQIPVPQLSLQVLRDPANFLLLVPVAVFFPGLSYHIPRNGRSHRHEATAGPVPHCSPDPFHQGANVFLKEETITSD